MGAFDLVSFLNAFLGGFNVPDLEVKVTEWLAMEGQKYPDLAKRAAEFNEWLTGVLEEAKPNLDPVSMAAAIKAIAASIVQGEAGVDPDAWMFG